MNRRIRSTGLLLFIFSLSLVVACVTINIYFPAEKVESVAGEIVRDVRGAPAKQEENDSRKQKEGALQQFFAAFSVSSAWAEDVTAVSNPTIRALKERMKRRYEQMKPYYRKGLIAEGGDGYVSIVKTDGLGLKGVRDLKSLVSAENKDRSALYAEVAKALKIDPSQKNRVASIFAKEWQKSTP